MKLIRLINCANEQGRFRFESSGGELRYQLERQLTTEDQFLIFDLVNHNPFDARLEVHFYTENASEKPDFSIILAILPDLKTPVVVPLSYLDGQSMNGATRPGILCTAIDGKRLAIDEIREIGIFMSPSHVRPLLEIDHVCLKSTDEGLSYDFKLEELVDEFGQYRGRNWQGKTQNQAELATYLNTELVVAKTYLSEQKTDFLGTGEAKFAATGFFHLERSEGKEILVTPDGKAFFSFGCAVVIPAVTGPFGVHKDYNYLQANLEKVWGNSSLENWQILTKYRLLKWGMNTVAAWSDLDFAQQAKLPYTVILDKGFPTTQAKIYRDFPDVFSDEYQENAEQYALGLQPFADDPFVIGYFMTNEPQFAFVRDLNLGYECLISQTETASKVELLSWLKAKFATIEQLNHAFQSDFSDFEALGQLTVKSKLSTAALNILDEFTEILICEFVRIPAEQLRKIAPHHLNLGMRYAFISSEHLFAGSEFMDIYSINCYNISAVDNIERIYAATGKNVMIGEFTFGALDRGLPATCIQGVSTQKERGRAISHYLETAKQSGHCVGVHHFQLNDEPYLGRFDGENYNIGLVDICNREYEEVTDEFKPIQRIPAIYF